MKHQPFSTLVEQILVAKTTQPSAPLLSKAESKEVIDISALEKQIDEMVGQAKDLPLQLATVDTNKCSGCEECLEVCPQGVFRMSGNLSDPYRAVECIFCEACLRVCTVGAITITPP